MNEATGLNLPSETVCTNLCCVSCEFLLLVCEVFGFYFISFFVCFCCLIVLVQSQSLSRRTTPFAPRVQVMGPV